MPLIKAFADEGEDLELIWLAGFAEHPEKGWQVRAITRGIESDRVVVHPLPIGLLSVLPLGQCYSNGDPASLRLHGEIVELLIPNVAHGKEDASACIPPDLFPIKGHERKVQRLLRYQVGGVEVLVPTIELIRCLFVHNKTMANALMRTSGIMDLCRPEIPGIYADLHLQFTDKMPVSVLKPAFVAEFAWTAVHPEGRRSWDSVAALSNGQRHVSFRPPPLENSHWTVRWMREKSTALVLEILHLTGKRHSCDVLRYSHPSMRKAVSFRPKGLMQDHELGSGEPPPVREIRDYVVDDRATGSRIDTHQSVLPVLTKTSSFDRVIEITKVAEAAAQEPAWSPDDDGEGPRSGQGRPTPETVIRRRVRVTASVGEEDAGATLPPIEFHLLEPADPNYLGELEPLIGALHLMAEMLPAVRIAMSLCALKSGRAVSVIGHRRRPCLITVLWPPSCPPLVLMDIDHSGGFSLSSLALRYICPLPFRRMEEQIKTLLDGMVDNHGRWDTDLADNFAGVCECIRLPRVLRNREQMDQKAYWKIWAMRLIERLGLEGLSRASP
ncbi:hypothetical protein [Azospirillum argentinense]|uniref:TnsE C-terminal domain-containing protein n=1 Tax=Azospirillum argentinense TaxID=2970906 RepID=A0A5B0L098_9PROT|nr:hypothetical protein [Azospirillum argentinense]KAA1057048.1 hypothetical protein FH063_003921 [Azospirillum argentinense]